MTNLFLRPVDVWLFRDGRPFDAGSAHRAESLFPPYPTTVQGAIRSHQLTLKGIGFTDKGKIKETVGTSKDYLNLKLRGPFLARIKDGTVERLYPQPADAIFDETNTSLSQLKIGEVPDGVSTSSSLPKLLGLQQDSGKQKQTYWLTETDLLKYLGKESVTGMEKDSLYETEDRIGIGIEKSHNRVVEEGMLYEAQYIRLKEDVGLLVEMSGFDNESEWEKDGVLQLGGESRAAQYQAVQVDTLPKVPRAKRLVIYLATPALFEGGWQPKWDDYFEGNPELVASAVDRYESIGGFDWSANPEEESAHRASRRFVPAGSVYYLEGTDNLVPKQESLSDFGAQIGFGQYIAKEW